MRTNLTWSKKTAISWNKEWFQRSNHYTSDMLFFSDSCRFFVSQAHHCSEQVVFTWNTYITDSKVWWACHHMCPKWSTACGFKTQIWETPVSCWWDTHGVNSEKTTKIHQNQDNSTLQVHVQVLSRTSIAVTYLIFYLRATKMKK